MEPAGVCDGSENGHAGMTQTTYALSDRTRSGIKGAEPYTEDELKAIAFKRELLVNCDQIGLAVIRLDGPQPCASRLAEHWVGDELDAFIASSMLKQASLVTDPDAQWDYVCRNGRVLRLRRMSIDGMLWAVFHDATIEHDHREVMDGTRDMGVGYIQYTVATDRIRIFGEFLDRKLSPNEQLDLRRTNFRSIIHSRDVERFDTMMADLIRTGEKITTVLEGSCRAEPSFRMQVSLRGVRSHTGEISKILGGFRDITAERMAQAELIRLRNEHTANLEARQFMSARIAHEIRTPLSGILGMAELLLKSPEAKGLESQLRILHDAARDAVGHMDTLAEAGRTGRDFETVINTPTDIRTLVSHAVELWRPQAKEKGVALQLRIADNVPGQVMLDGRRLRQCLANLLSNAVKFTESGGIGVVLATMMDNGEETLVIAVRDTGIGMNEDEQRQLFVPFVQANNGISGRFGGSGLGMSITKGIINRMNGKLACRSIKGEGTTFSLSLPLEAVESETQTSAGLVDSLLQDTAVPAQTAQGLRVLAVDDNETNRMVVEQLLSGHVASVTSARHGREALELLDTQDFDVVLMDVHMPIMDGIEATIAIRASRQSWSDIPIIALTADEQYQRKRVVLNIGMDEAMAKPITQTKILSAFERLKLVRREPEAKAA